MFLPSMRTQVLAAVVALAVLTFNGNAQVQASSASYVNAEMTKGKLNPAESKPGDQIALKLKDDVKSNGEVVLKKGTVITGIVKNVKRTEGKSEAHGQAQSMMEIEWLAPAAQGKVAKDLSIALQSVTQVSPIYQRQHDENVGDDLSFGGAVAAPARGGANGGLLGGALGATTGVTAGAVGGVNSTLGSVGSAGSASTRSSSKSNAALLNMPSVIAVDHQTTSAIETSLGSSSPGQLFQTGRGELVSSGGSRQSVELFSHLNNDTVITSQNKNFEISSGAQMQLLVGVNNQ